MPYTLTKGLLWFALALVLGVAIGWLLRSIRATRQLRAARAHHPDAAELARLRARLAELEPASAPVPEPAAPVAVAERPVPEPAAPEASEPVAAPPDAPADEPPAGGAPYPLDDLTVIEGIGPEIAQLINRIGIHTWAELADTEVSLLRTMLADAGPDFADHRPDTWPEQAAHLAAGRWDDFAALAARVRGGVD